MIDSFCLTRGESDENWTVNESELQKVVMRAEKRADECEALPSRKKLLKRIKKIAMSFAGAVPDGEKDPLNDNSAIDNIITKKHGFCVIDQSKHQNILLAVMIHGLLVMKRAAKTHTVKSYAKSIFGEIDVRIEDLMETDESDPLIQVLEETKKGILLYSNNLQKHARAAKNVLRVMVSSSFNSFHCGLRSLNSFLDSLGKILFLLKFLQSHCSPRKRSQPQFPMQPKLICRNSRRRNPAHPLIMYSPEYFPTWMTTWTVSMNVCI